MTMSIDHDIDELLGPLEAAEVVDLRAPALTLVQADQPTPPQVLEFERCKAWIAEALEGGRHTIADVARDLLEGKAQLWPGKACAMVTEVHQFPAGKALKVWLGGGDMTELMSMHAGVMAWGRLMGCTEVIIEGRRGWERVLKPMGFELAAITLRKAI